MEKIKQFVLQHADGFGDFFCQTSMLAIVVLDESMRISAHNDCFGTLVTSREDVSGKPVHSYLLSESQGLLPLPETKKDQSIMLNFKAPDSSAVPLQCHIFRLDDGKHVILGGHLMLTHDQILHKMTALCNEMANMARDLHRKNAELKEANSKIKLLSGIVPICMHCKGIRDDKGYWNRLEEYITEHSELQFSHGICDDCLAKYYSDDDL